MFIPISKIGKTQREDIENSSMGWSLYSDYGRICRVIDPDDMGDRSPHRMAALFGGDWRDYNYHYIVQVAGCPFKCWYCYVDNLRQDCEMSISDIVDDFEVMRIKAKELDRVDINVLHFMGGCPGKYCVAWPLLREELDRCGLREVVLYSNAILVEYNLYGIQPWAYSRLPNVLIAGCLKGVDKDHFYSVTGCDSYDVAVEELRQWAKEPNFYLTLVDDGHIPEGFDIFGLGASGRLDILALKKYRVVQERLTRSNK